MSAPVMLRIHGLNNVITNVTMLPTSTIKDLFEVVKSSQKLSGEFDLLSGFPPEPLKLPMEALVVGNIRSNEAVRVRLKTSEPAIVQGNGKYKRSSGSKRKNNTIGTQSSPQQAKHDISESLLGAVSGGKGKDSKILRGLFQAQVGIQYDLVQSEARVDAVFAGLHRFKNSVAESSSSSSSASCERVEVVYPKGMGSRNDFLEAVDIIPKEVLDEVIRLALDDSSGPQGREALKPQNMSLLSPRILWSLAYHYGNDLFASIKTILRNDCTDFQWLEQRKRELSEKGKLSQSQKKVRKTKPQETNLADDCLSPEELSIITKLDCIPESMAENVLKTMVYDSLVLTEEFGFVPQDWIYTLKHVIGDERIAVLASIEPNETFLEKLIRYKSHTLLNLEQNSEQNEQVNDLSLDELDSWVSSAQRLVIKRIWNIICGGEESINLRNALKNLRITYPVHLMNWKNVSGALLVALTSMNRDLSASNVKFPRENSQGSIEFTLITDKLNVYHIDTAIAICDSANKTFDWLEFYRSNDLIE